MEDLSFNYVHFAKSLDDIYNAYVKDYASSQKEFDMCDIVIREDVDLAKLRDSIIMLIELYMKVAI